MCRRKDSIEALGAAADRLTRVCSAELAAVPQPERIDPSHPSSAGTIAALRSALGDLSTTPADMAIQLGKLSGRGK